MGIMQEQTRHRSDAHGHVVGESVISEGFSPAIGRRDVDDQRVAAYVTVPNATPWMARKRMNTASRLVRT